VRILLAGCIGEREAFELGFKGRDLFLHALLVVAQLLDGAELVQLFESHSRYSSLVRNFETRGGLSSVGASGGLLAFNARSILFARSVGCSRTIREISSSRSWGRNSSVRERMPAVAPA